MNHEIDIYGVFVPDLLLLVVLTYLASLAVRRLLTAIGFYRLVWHRALFDLALYVILLGAAVAITEGFQS